MRVDACAIRNKGRHMRWSRWPLTCRPKWGRTGRSHTYGYNLVLLYVEPETRACLTCSLVFFVTARVNVVSIEWGPARCVVDLSCRMCVNAHFFGVFCCVCGVCLWFNMHFTRARRMNEEGRDVMCVCEANKCIRGPTNDRTHNILPKKKRWWFHL